MSTVDPTPVLDLILAFRSSKAMFAAVELGVFDALDPVGTDAEGRRGAESLACTPLAERLDCHAESLRRLLDACVGLGLLQRQGAHYRNTPLARELLCQSSPNRMTGYIRFSNEASWKLWTHLEDAVREGGHRWQQAYGWDGPIFGHLFHDEQSKREFLMGMHGFGVISSPQVVRAFDLSRFKQLADLGAATGHLVIAACEAYPSLKAIAFDLPEAVPLAREIINQSTVASRVHVQAGDFFTDTLPPADLYSLGRILHDWSDDKIHQLCSRIHAALPAGGGLLVAEKLVAPERDGPVMAQMQDLNMLVCTEGRERTLVEYQTLLHSIGFSSVEGRTTGAPVDAVLAIK